MTGIAHGPLFAWQPPTRLIPEPEIAPVRTLTAAGDQTAPTAPIGATALRPYQLAADACIEAQFEAGRRATLAVLPTGTGKTVLFSATARRELTRGRRTLVLAHRTELLDQALAKLRDAGITDARIEQANQRAGAARVVVASVQTLRGKRLEAFPRDYFGLIIVDEAPHVCAASYRAILDHFASARVLGVTATAKRADGKALGLADGGVFETVAYRYELRDAIRDQWLVPIRARRIVVDGVDLSSVRTRGGDLDQDELAAVMATEQAVHGVVAPLLEQAGSRRTVVFCVNVAHARAVAEVLERHVMGCARVAHGELVADVRAQLLRDFRAGAFQFLVNCQLYTEGFDEPSVACVAIARPTKSWTLFVQMVGRGTRLLGPSLAASIAAGKSDMLLLDLTGRAGKHKLVGPIDALAAGDVPDDLRREGDRLLAAGAQDLDQLMDDAQRELERRKSRAQLTAKARYWATEVNPFFGDELGPPIAAAWAQQVAGQAERLQLEELGFAPPLGMTLGDALRITQAMRERKERGLASKKQVALLAKFGCDARGLTIARAGKRIDALKQSEFKRGPFAIRLAAIADAETKSAGAVTRHIEESSW